MEHAEREHYSSPKEDWESLGTLELQHLVRNGAAYPGLYERFCSEHTLEPVIRHLKETPGSDLETLDFLDKRSWNLLAFLDVFDPHLLEHSIKTYEIAKHKVEKELLHGIVLAHAFEHEGVQLEEFYRTCLLHDIGKITIPYEVLNTVTTQEEELAHLERLVNTARNASVRERLNLDPNDSHIYTEEELRTLLDSNHLRPFRILPASTILPPHAVEALQRAGLSPNQPLSEIIERHEAMSEKILRNEGFSVEADLAGHHHNYKHECVPYHITLESLQISIDIADIIRLADAEQALGSARSYKNPFSKLSVLEALVRDAEAGHVGKEITYLWIQDEFIALKPPVSSPGEHPSHEERQYAIIKSFLEQESRCMGAWIQENALTTSRAS